MSKCPVAPIGTYIAAKRIKPKEKTDSGLFILPKEKDNSKSALVHAVGKDVKEIKVGDHIIFRNHPSIDIKLKEDEFVLVKEEDTVTKVL